MFFGEKENKAKTVEDLIEKKTFGYEFGLDKKTRVITSTLGRAMTTIDNAREKYSIERKYYNPFDYINKEDSLNYYGMTFAEKEDSPVYIKDTETTHEIYIGSTGTGKGVLLGNRVLEAIKRKKGVIIIDPKQDVFLPQICLEELERQCRVEDLQILNWSTDFGYTGISEKDSYVDIANKLQDALNLGETGDGAVDYYRENYRIMLKKVLPIFFSGVLGVEVKKDLLDIAIHFQHLKEDLEKEDLLLKENSKMRPNFTLIKKYEERYFDKDSVDSFYWDSTAVSTLDGLAKKIMEFCEAGNIYNKYSLDGALYEGKVLYVKCDMLDISSLKMVKILIADAIQKARRKRANTIIIADELSFYATKTLSGALATVRSMGLKFLLALQDLAQMEDGIGEAILSNCNIKLFYKISDMKTLNYIEKIGGEEAITSFKTGETGYSVSQAKEPLLNATKIRALPRSQVGILIAEALNTAVLTQTSFVKTSREFDWTLYEDINYFKEKEEKLKQTLIKAKKDFFSKVKTPLEEESFEEESSIENEIDFEDDNGIENDL